MKNLNLKTAQLKKYISFLLIKIPKIRVFLKKVEMLNAGKRKTGTPMPRWCDFEMAQTWWVAIWQKVSRALKYAWSLT